MTQLDDETELDIDQFSTPTLSRLHDLIIKHVPGIVPPKPEPAARSAKPSKPKKNKPMSKHEQENKIETLKKLKQEFEQRQGSTSDDAVTTGRVVQCGFSHSHPINKSCAIDTDILSLAVEQDQSSGDEESSDSEED